MAAVCGHDRGNYFFAGWLKKSISRFTINVIMAKLYAIEDDAKEPVVMLEDVDGPITFSPTVSEFAFRRRFEEQGSTARRFSWQTPATPVNSALW